MTIKALIERQVRWAETLSRFNFIIIYCARSQSQGSERFLIEVGRFATEV
jgi:hypothetical protein